MTLCQNLVDFCLSVKRRIVPTNWFQGYDPGVILVNDVQHETSGICSWDNKQRTNEVPSRCADKVGDRMCTLVYKQN